jgi:hypothetical protein
VNPFSRFAVLVILLLAPAAQASIFGTAGDALTATPLAPVATQADTTWTHLAGPQAASESSMDVTNPLGVFEAAPSLSVGANSANNNLLQWAYPEGIHKRDVAAVEIYRIVATEYAAAPVFTVDGQKTRFVDELGSAETVYAVRAILNDGSTTDMSNTASRSSCPLVPEIYVTPLPPGTDPTASQWLGCYVQA